MRETTNISHFRALPVLQGIIANEMCTGCGVCIAQKGVGEGAKMKWNENGFLVPDFKGVESLPDKSLAVCPFNPFPEPAVRTEDELADYFLQDAEKKRSKIGRYENCYVGYSPAFRITSSSGGMASYITYQLLEQGIVDAIFAVKYGQGVQSLYQYEIIRSKEEILQFSKTKYYPVTMAEAMKKLTSIQGRVAIVGIPCFIKAVRLHQFYNPADRGSISFLIGIVCGGLKSKFFGEYLASKSGADPEHFAKPEFRVKDPQSNALDYAFECEDLEGKGFSIKMKSVGDMWGTGFFKNNACDFCDDVAAELADITLGDAWISPYMQDGRGSNVIITRSELADSIVKSGLEKGNLVLDSLSEERFIESQQGGYNHRHRGMKYRIDLKKRSLTHVPPKRFAKQHIALEFKWVQKMRMKIRRLSLAYWAQEKNAISFDLRLRPYIKRLRFYTLGYHKLSRIRKIVTKIMK